MNSSKYRFTLDMHTAQSQVSLPVVLNDTARKFYISLADGGKIYHIADGCLAVIRIERPTGTYIEHFCPIEDNTNIVYDFAQNEHTAIVEGLHECEVTLYGLDGGVITTARFNMIVSARVVDSDNVEITDENWTVIDSIAEEEARRQAAETARENAEDLRIEAERERVAAESERETSTAIAIEAANSTAEMLLRKAENGEFDGKDGRDGVDGKDGVNGTDGTIGPVGPVGMHIGPEAPTDGQVAWIDTNEEPEKKEINIPTPDFAASEDEDGHILNRTHFVDKDGVVHKLDNKYIDADWMATSEEHIATAEVIPEQKVTSTWSNLQYLLQPGITYDVIINDIVYPCVAWGSGAVQLGNNTSLSKNDYPFCVYWAGGTATMGMFFYDENVFSSPIYLKVTEHSWTDYNKLPEEFLPDGVVKSVNGIKPDENGNVEVKGGVEVTAEVGQTIRVTEVDENGKPTKWEAADYQPRTHWSEPCEVLPETTCEVIEDIGAAVLPDMEVSAGDNLTVKYNGTEYKCTCADMGDGMLAFGNYGVMVDPENPVDTGEPFAAVKTDDGNGALVWGCVPLDGSATFTLSVIGEAHHTIPNKYIETAWLKSYVGNQINKNIVSRAKIQTVVWSSSVLEVGEVDFNDGGKTFDICESLSGTGGFIWVCYDIKLTDSIVSCKAAVPISMHNAAYLLTWTTRLGGYVYKFWARPLVNGVSVTVTKE